MVHTWKELLEEVVEVNIVTTFKDTWKGLVRSQEQGYGPDTGQWDKLLGNLDSMDELGRRAHFHARWR